MLLLALTQHGAGLLQGSHADSLFDRSVPELLRQNLHDFLPCVELAATMVSRHSQDLVLLHGVVPPACKQLATVARVLGS